MKVDGATPTRGRFVWVHHKPIHGSCAIYFPQVLYLGGGLKYFFLCSHLLGEMIQNWLIFFSKGLKPPSRYIWQQQRKFHARSHLRETRCIWSYQLLSVWVTLALERLGAELGFFGGEKRRKSGTPKWWNRFLFIRIWRLELFCMMKHLIDLWSIYRICMVQDGLCESLKTTSRCDMDTVDVDVNDLIFSTSILGKIKGFFCGPKTGFSLPKKGRWNGETLRFPVGKLLGCEKFRSGLKMVTILVVMVLGILGRIAINLFACQTATKTAKTGRFDGKTQSH